MNQYCCPYRIDGLAWFTDVIFEVSLCWENMTVCEGYFLLYICKPITTPAQINGLDIKHVTGERSEWTEDNEKDSRHVWVRGNTKGWGREKTQIMKSTEQKNRAKYQAPCREALYFIIGWMLAIIERSRLLCSLPKLKNSTASVPSYSLHFQIKIKREI